MTPFKDREAMARVLGLLGQSRIAENLNQLSLQAKAGSLLLDEETTSRIDEACRHVCSMRSALMKALGLLGASSE